MLRAELNIENRFIPVVNLKLAELHRHQQVNEVGEEKKDTQRALKPQRMSALGLVAQRGFKPWAEMMSKPKYTEFNTNGGGNRSIPV